MEEKQNVNHPSHYTQHPLGIECIDVIRHYTCDIANAIKYLWRAGLKQDADKTAIDKELEDLGKALWYINDYLDNRGNSYIRYMARDILHVNVLEMTHHTIEDITGGYLPDVAEAMKMLLYVGIIYYRDERNDVHWRDNLATASDHINQRIKYLKSVESNTQNLPPEVY